MNKKKLNTILIVAVSAIWGLLLYKFISPYFTEVNTEIMAEVPENITTAKIRKKDSITLSFPERDPFLGKSVKKKVSIQAAKKANKRSTAILKPVLWPKIQYLGFVKSKNSKGKLGLLRIDGKLHRVNQNAEVEGLRIKKITDDSLVIVNGKEERNFKKK